MTDVGYTEEDIIAETDNCETVEQPYLDGMEKIKDAMEQSALFLTQARLVGIAESWLDHSNPASTTYVSQGNDHIEQLSVLMSKLEIHSDCSETVTTLLELELLHCYIIIISN